MYQNLMKDKNNNELKRRYKGFVNELNKIIKKAKRNFDKNQIK